MDSDLQYSECPCGGHRAIPPDCPRRLHYLKLCHPVGASALTVRKGCGKTQAPVQQSTGDARADRGPKVGHTLSYSCPDPSETLRSGCTEYAFLGIREWLRLQRGHGRGNKRFETIAYRIAGVENIKDLFDNFARINPYSFGLLAILEGLTYVPAYRHVGL